MIWSPYICYHLVIHMYTTPTYFFYSLFTDLNEHNNEIYLPPEINLSYKYQKRFNRVMKKPAPGRQKKEISLKIIVPHLESPPQLQEYRSWLIQITWENLLKQLMIKLSWEKNPLLLAWMINTNTVSSGVEVNHQKEKHVRTRAQVHNSV